MNGEPFHGSPFLLSKYLESVLPLYCCFTYRWFPFQKNENSPQGSHNNPGLQNDMNTNFSRSAPVEQSKAGTMFRHGATLALSLVALGLAGCGHSEGDKIVNRWFGLDGSRSWTWPRLPGAFHGSGCTLASGIAALLAQGYTMAQALDGAQAYCHDALAQAYSVAAGQAIPDRYRAKRNL